MDFVAHEEADCNIVLSAALAWPDQARKVRYVHHSAFASSPLATLSFSMVIEMMTENVRSVIQWLIHPHHRRKPVDSPMLASLIVMCNSVSLHVDAAHVHHSAHCK